MIFTGTFKTYDNINTYSLVIGSTGTTKTIVDPLTIDTGIAASDMIVMFAPDPVNIYCDRDDLTKRIIISQATINLVSNQNLTNYLFADTSRSIPVTITTNNEHVFYGYVDPLQFSQAYAHKWEDIQITATDPLGALEQLKVDDAYFNGIFYDVENNIKKPKTCKSYDILTSILKKAGLNSTTPIGIESMNVSVKNAMQGTKINMSVFFGDSQDDYKNLYEVLEEVCKYFNLYVAMYSADTAIVVSTINQSLTEVTISNFKNKATDDSTSLSTDDVYSRISLACEIEPVEDFFESFDDKDKLYSDYNSPEKYMTEYVSAGEGRHAWDAFYKMINDNVTDYDSCYTKDHYMIPLRNDAWDFGTTSNYITYMGGSDTTPMTNDQLDLLTWLAGAKCRAAIVGYGSGNEIKQGMQDNSVQGYINTENYLMISTMGTFGNTDSDFSTYDTAIYNAKPLCTYKGLNENFFSPTDARVTNYLIFTGSVILNPLAPKTGSSTTQYGKVYTNTFQDALDNFTWVDSYTYDSDGDLVNSTQRGCMYHTVPITDNGDGGYYQQKWYSGTNGVYGFLDNNKSKYFKYEYNSPGDSTDKISKLPILACQLKVGDKYCVERLDMGEDGINEFQWLTAAQCSALHLEPYFTIGIDPKIGDQIAGQKYQFSNNIDYKVNIDTTGMAIPVKASDNLSGTIEFSILGPYNLAWNQVTKSTSHRAIFWSHTTWNSNLYSVLNNIQSIMVNSLKIEMKSNNGGMSQLRTTADNDLVYYSNMNPAYTDDLESDIIICTPLTLDECLAKGIKFQTSNSHVLISSDDPDIDGNPFRGFMIIGSGVDISYVKPEECFIDYLYKEYNSPAKIVDTQVKASTFTNGLKGNTLNYEMLKNYFTGLPISGNLQMMSYDTDLKYKTINTKFRTCNTVTNSQI